MRSNYRRIGDCIKLVDERNTDLQVTNLIGISISKEIIPSVANTVGTDMSKYKIIRKNQFACSTMQVRRDKKMPVAILKEVDEALISAAYPVFEVIDENIILPDYLMMWFSRPEFDREACFYAIGGVRGSIEWEDFCNMQLPVPSIEKQREIVKEYKVLQDRIRLNNKLIEKLEDTAQSIYKQWFVDFDFPDENGNPYKSSGGKMEFNETLDKEIPVGWKEGELGELITVVNGFAFKSDEFEDYGMYPIIKITNITVPYVTLVDSQYYSGEITNGIKKCIVEKGDILISMTGSHMNQMNSAVGKVGRYNKSKNALLNQRVGKLKAKDGIECSEFIYRAMLSDELQKQLLVGATGSANQANISANQITLLKIAIPSKKLISFFDKLIGKFNENIVVWQDQNEKLFLLKELLLSKIATVEG